MARRLLRRRGGGLMPRCARSFLLRDAGVDALVVSQITVIHTYPSRVVKNTFAR